MKKILAVLAMFLATAASAAVTTLTSSVSYSCNSGTTAFTITFPFQTSSDLVVTRTLVSTGAITTLTNGVDFTVTGSTLTTAGGSSPCATGNNLTITRLTPRTQPLALRTQGAISPKALESAYDRSLLIEQELDRDKLAVPPACPVGQVLTSNGSALVCVVGVAAGAASDTATVVAFGSSAARTLRDRFAERFSLKDFGAVCNGSTDDSAALTAAITAIGANVKTLVVPDSCFVGSAIVIPSNIIVEFLGIGFTASSSVLFSTGTPAHVQKNPNDQEVRHLIRPMAPAPQAPTTFPMGNDLELDVRGPADAWIKVQPLDYTCTTTVTAGVGRVVTVGSGKVGAVASEQVTVGDTSKLAPPSSGVTLLIDPYTANEEIVTSANWSVTSATTLTITFAKAHTQPYIIRQEGSGVLEMRRMVIRPLHGATGNLKPLEFQDANLFDIMELPSNLTTTYPDNAITLNAYLTGNWRGLGDFRLRMPASPGRFIFTDFGGTNELMAIDSTGLTTFGGAGNVQIQNALQHFGTDFLITSDKFIRVPKVHVDGSIRATFGGNSDLSGSLTVGAGGNVTYTFTETYVAGPDCVCSDTSSTPTVCGANATTTTLTLYGTNGHALHYICLGKGN